MTDTANARIWENADVLVSFNLAAEIPDNPSLESFGVDWDVVGLLDGTEGFVRGFDESSSDKWAWGNRLVRRTYTKGKETHKFTALEDNPTVRRIINRGEVPDGVLVVPSGPPERCLLALVTVDSGVDVQRARIYDAVEISVDGDIKDAEEDITAVGFMAQVFTTDGTEAAAGFQVSGVELTSEAASS